MKKSNKKWLAAALAVTLTTAQLPANIVPVAMAGSGITYDDIKDIPIEDMTEEQLKVKNEHDISIASKYVNNYQEIDKEPPISVSEYDNYISQNYATSQETSYDPRTDASITMPAIRNQNPLGTCWAHSTQCMVEMNLAKQGYNINDDMSEFQTVYFMNHNWTDPLGLCTNDTFHSIVKNSGSTDLNPEWYTEGNSVGYSKFLLMDWAGSVSEAKYPETAYDILKDKKNKATLDDSYAIEKDAAHVQEVIEINMTDHDIVKQMVKEYGSVGMSYYADDDKFYQSNCYYNNVNKTTNHAVTIVGWDDNFDKSKFKITPSDNGAWLVRNSWGDWYADKGYFWLSYYDTSIARTGYAVKAVSSSDQNGYYDHNYQYDGGISTRAVSMSYSGNPGNKMEEANIFKAQGKEILKAVSFYTYANYNYTVDIYKNLTDNNKPDSGTKVSGASVSGTQDFEGYHTVSLNSNVELEPEDTFSVIVILSANNAGEAANIALDSTFDGGFMYSQAEALKGQSFYRPSGYPLWVDAAEKNRANVRIKAYTVNSATKPIEKIEFTETSIDLKSKDIYNLQDIIKKSPEDTDDSISFSSDDKTVATVDSSGKVTAIRPGKAVITASAYAGTAKAKITINVGFAMPAESIKISPETLKLSKGEKQKLEAVLLPEGTDDYVKTWASSDSTVASVNTDGEVTGVASGSAIVTAQTASGKEASCQVTVVDRALGEVINCVYNKLPKKIYKYNTYIVSLSNAMSKLSPDSIIWESSSPNVEVTPSGTNGTGGCVLYVKNVASGNKGEKITLKATVTYKKVTRKKVLTKTKAFKRRATAVNLSYSVALDKTEIYITEKGARINLTAILNDGKSDDQPTSKKLKWIITDSDGNRDKKGGRVASVSGKGVVKAKGPGVTYVTVCTTDSYVKAEKKYKVMSTICITCQPVTSVGFNEASVTLSQGSTTDLKQKLVFNGGNSVPYNKDGMKLTWASSDKRSVSINRKGVVKVARKAAAGTYTITVKATGGVPKGETVPQAEIKVIVPSV